MQVDQDDVIQVDQDDVIPVVQDDAMQVDPDDAIQVDEDDAVPVRKEWSFKDKSKAQKSRDRDKVSKAGTPNAIISTAARAFQERGQYDAAYVVKALNKNPEETGKYKFSITVLLG